MSWKNGDPSQNTLCHSTTKKNLLQLVPHLATSSKILQCKIIVVQTCKNEKHQLDVMICWTNMLHLSIYLPILYLCYIYLSMHAWSISLTKQTFVKLVNHDYFITFKNREYTKGLTEFLLRSTIIIIWNEKCTTLDEDK